MKIVVDVLERGLYRDGRLVAPGELGRGGARLRFRGYDRGEEAYTSPEYHVMPHGAGLTREACDSYGLERAEMARELMQRAVDASYEYAAGAALNTIAEAFVRPVIAR